MQIFHSMRLVVILSSSFSAHLYLRAFSRYQAVKQAAQACALTCARKLASQVGKILRCYAPATLSLRRIFLALLAQPRLQECATLVEQSCSWLKVC